MENTFSQKILYFIAFSTLIMFGYIVGLMTFPVAKPLVAIKKSTVSIENAKLITENFDNPVGNNTDLPPLQVREINPFNGGKIVNIPKPHTQITNNNNNNMDTLRKDPRITMIPQTFYGENNPNDNPMGYVSGSDKVEIEISGGEQTSQIGSKNLIDDLSSESRSKSKQQQPEQNDIAQKIHDPFAPRTPLMNAPHKEYTEKKPVGILPKSPAGKKPLWQVYANQTQMNPEKKPIAYVLGGLGNDYNLTVEAIKTLPSEVTLGFIPYTPNLQALIDMAREYGHETILEIPMESHDFPRLDAGMLALKIQDTPEEYTSKLETLLSRASGYSGVMNYLGSKYILDDKSSVFLLNDLKKRGLYFVENKTIRAGVLSEVAQSNQIPYASSFDIIDEILSPSMINNSLSVIEKNTLAGTPVVGTAYLSPLSLSLLRTRIMGYIQNKQNDIQLIPISSYVKTKN